MNTPESLVDLQLFSPVMSSACRTAANPNASASGLNNNVSNGRKANLNALLVAGGGRWIKKENIDAYLSEKEDDYSFLDSKPELKQRGAVGKKGRRHAGEALLQRKLQRQAFLVKDVLLGGVDPIGDKTLGKKRRSRLLSEHLEDFNVSVPYSLNRKNRWDALEDAAGCLIGSNHLGPVAEDQPLKYSIVQSYFKLTQNQAPNQTVKLYQEYDCDGQLLLRRQANSSRGSTLANLLKQQPERDLESIVQPLGNRDLNVQYRLSKAPPSAKLMGLDLPSRNKYRGRLLKRNTNELVGKLAKGGALDSYEEEELDEEEDLVTSMYRPKKNETFSLADFLKDSSEEQAVIVRRNKSMESFEVEDGELEEDYNFIQTNGNDLVESTCIKTQNTHETHPASYLLTQLKNSKEWFFETVDIPTKLYTIEDSTQWKAQCQLLSQKAKIRFHQLSSTQMLVDLTQLLLAENQQAQRPLLAVMLDLGESKMIINSGFKCPLEERRLETLLQWKTFASGQQRGLCELVDLVVEACKPFYLSHIEAKKVFQSTVLEPFKSNYNSHQLSTLVKPIDIYAILQQKAPQQKFSLNDQQFVLLSEEETSLEDKEEDSLSDISDFETIEMDEFEEESGSKNAEQKVIKTTVIPKEKSSVLCENCDNSNGGIMLTLEACGHQFCAKCLSQTALAQLETGQLPLKCMSSICECQMPLELLQVLLPLPIANYGARLDFVQNGIACDKIVSECPACTELVTIEQIGEFPQLCCSQCRIHWCINCRKQPHWPMECQQAEEWSKKFEQQYELDRQRAAGFNNNDENHSNEKQNAIAQQFSTICSESRARRYDLKSAFQLSKNMRRLKDYKAERQFMDLRKTALHLLEYGYGWLYMNRNSSSSSDAQLRPHNWTQIKALLSTLRSKVEDLESEVLFSSSLTDSNALLDKVQAMEQLVSKVIDKFQA